MNGDYRFAAFHGRTCLVTGGAGAIGSQLVRRLVGLGARAVVLDDLSSGHLENLAPVLSRIQVIHGSVAIGDDLKKAFANRPDYIFHLAAHFANQNSIERPWTDMQTNVVGTQMILDQARSLPKLPTFVYASSSCVLGGQNGVMTEEMRSIPETPYGVSKLAGEHYTLVYAAVYGLPAAVVRYFNVYGPGEYPGRYRNVIPNFMHRALHGQPLPITGSGTETREFVFVSDAVEGTLLAAVTSAAKGQVFHLGSGCVATISELAQKIVQQSGGRSTIEIFPRRSWDGVAHRQTCFEKARQVLAYTPKTSLDDGLRATWVWMKALEESQGCVATEEQAPSKMVVSARRSVATAANL